MVREGLFTRRRRRRRLLGSRCTVCGNVLFPRVDGCTYCSADDPEPVELAGPGTLWSWTAVTAPPPGYQGEVPFGVGVVELPEGVRVITRLTESDPAALSAGQAMELRIVPAAPRRGRQRRRDLRLRPGERMPREQRRRRSPGSVCIPSGASTASSTTDMGVVAVRAALREAGVGKGGFQAAFCGTAYGGVATGHKVLSRMGLTGMPIVDVEAGCASGGAALMLAAGAIRAGQYDTVLVFGTEKMPKGIIRSSFFEPWQEEAGLAATPAFFALRAQRLMLTSGVTKDHLARVVVKNRRHGASNPDAMYQKETSVEEVLALARRVRAAAPLHVVLAQRGRGGRGAAPRRPGRRRRAAPVTLAAAVLRSHIPGPVLSESTPLAGLADDDVPAPSTLGRHRRLRGGGARSEPISTWSSARTPMPHASFSPAKSSACASRAGPARCSTRAPPSSAAASRSTRAAACSPRASRSAPRRSVRWSSWCASCAASAALGRSRVRASRCRTPSAVAPTPVSSS